MMPRSQRGKAEILRLERFIWDAVYALQKAVPDREAARRFTSRKGEIGRGTGVMLVVVGRGRRR